MVKNSAIESSINAIAIADLHGTLTYVNPSFLRLWGYEDAQEVLGKQNVEFWQHKEKAKDVVKALYDEGTWIGELSAKRKDSSLFDVQLSASIVKNENDEPICMMASFLDITERKKAEEELKGSEERLKILFEYAPDAYYLNNLKGIFLDGNKTAEELIGYKREELIGKSFLKLKMLSPDQILKAAGLLAKNKLGKSTGPDKFILNRKDGNQIPLEIRTIPVKIKGQSLVLGIARDITERKKSEEKLRESEEKFRNIVELSPDGIIIIDLKGIIITCNPAFLSLTGFSKKEIVGKHFTKLPTSRRRHVKDIPKYTKMFNTILRGEVPKPLEMTWLHKDGTVRLGEFHVSLMKKDRKTIGIQVIARDITERKQAEEALRESEETLRATVDSSRDWIWSVDIEGNHTYSNPAIEEILGYTPDELIGKSSLDLMHPEDRKEIEGMLPRWIKEKRGWQNLVIRWQHKDGSLRWLESNAVPIFDSEGRLIGFRGVDRDITRRRQAEKALVIQNKYNELRAEIWEKASDPSLKEEIGADFSIRLPEKANILG